MKAEYQSSMWFLSVSLMAAVSWYERQSVCALNKVGTKNCGRKERQMADATRGFTGAQETKTKLLKCMHACEIFY